MVDRPTAGVAVVAALVLLGGLGVVGLQQVDREQPYAEQAAVEAFRAASPSPSATPTGRPAASPSGAGPASAAAPVRASSPAAPGSAVARTGAPAAPASAAPSAAPREVEPGVYRYATEGHEQVDALGGARHDYPATSTITYTRKDCGTEERWQPLEGRVGVSVYCAGAGGPELRTTYQQREFFGRSQSESYRCQPGVLVRPRDPRPGQSWTGRCLSDDSTVTITGRVVALEELDVGGARVPVVRIAIRGAVTGSVRGRADREVWLARADGLMVQATGDTDTEADTPAGPVRYRESYRLRLQSLSPRR